MDLLIDLGNSRIKWARSAPGVWETHAVVLAPSELGALLDQAWAAWPPPQRVVAASVVSPARYRELERWVQGHWGCPIQRVRAQGEFLGVKNRYRDPGTLGADRWAALIAARHLSQRPTCVVGCGTAVTVDALSAQGEFLGGIIFPGLRVMRTALAQWTDGVQEIAGEDTSCLALSTGDAVAAGTLFGLVGAIERVIGEQRAIMGASDVLLTGADSPLVAARIGLPVQEIPDLVLRGVALIAQRLA